MYVVTVVNIWFFKCNMSITLSDNTNKKQGHYLLRFDAKQNKNSQNGSSHFTSYQETNYQESHWSFVCFTVIVIVNITNEKVFTFYILEWLLQLLWCSHLKEISCQLRWVFPMFDGEVKVNGRGRAGCEEGRLRWIALVVLSNPLQLLSDESTNRTHPICVKGQQFSNANLQCFVIFVIVPDLL